MHQPIKQNRTLLLAEQRLTQGPKRREIFKEHKSLFVSTYMQKMSQLQKAAREIQATPSGLDLAGHRAGSMGTSGSLRMLHCLCHRPKRSMKRKQGENIPLGTKLAPALFLRFPPRGRGGVWALKDSQHHVHGREASPWPAMYAPRGRKAGWTKECWAWVPVWGLEGAHSPSLAQRWI